MLTIFTLTNARSGTTYLCDLFKQNVKNCVCVHEPYFKWSNPNMFGKAIYDHLHGDVARTKKLLQRKQRYLLRHAPNAYIETSHAFLKSYYNLAHDYFPNMKFIHLIRDPIKVAKSAANRERTIHGARLPFRNYRGRDGQRYFRWSLTRKEPIFQNVHIDNPSLFQLYLIEWIEIENRAIRFLDEHDKNRGCFKLHAPYDLNKHARLQEMFDYFELDLICDKIKPGKRHNATHNTETIISSEEEAQMHEIVSHLPITYLDIFKKEPYKNYDWAMRLYPI